MGGWVAGARISYSERVRVLAESHRYLRVCEPGEQARSLRSDWRAADRALRKIARVRVGLDAAEARWLRVAVRTKVWLPLGMASIIEYLERTLGYKPRDAYERIRVAEALEPLRGLTSALKENVFCWSAVRELTRVVVPETEVEWIEAARGKTVREIEAMVSGRKPGDRPTDPASWDAKRYMISFEVSGATRALFREAMEKVRRDAGSRLDDDATLAMVAREVLGGPKDDGRAGHQIVVMKCPDCGRVGQESAGTVVPLDDVQSAVAECDAQVVELPSAHVGRADVEADGRAHAHVGEGAGHSGDGGRTSGRATTAAKARTRATQTIPPATRRLVVRRQHKRCAVPGCAHSVYLALHHVHLRSEGGSHDPDQLLAICSAHHTAVHEGRLSIEGRFSTGFTFTHADGTAYGGAVAVDRATSFADAFDALRRLGYREGESRRALDAIRAHVGRAEAASALVVRALTILRG